jgi:hypothetical protein
MRRDLDDPVRLVLLRSYAQVGKIRADSARLRSRIAVLSPGSPDLRLHSATLKQLDFHAKVLEATIAALEKRDDGETARFAPLVL